MNHKTKFLLLPLALFLSGCTGPETTANGQPAAEQSPSSEKTGFAQADLPPEGQVDDGGKPPMPAPVEVARAGDYAVENYVTGLEIPWDMAWAGEGRLYVTERPGRVRLVEDAKLAPEPYATVNASHRGEGGLMGIALHPDYPDEKWVYLMYTYTSGGGTYNKVTRLRDTGSGLADEEPVLEGIPGSGVHNGGIIRFGPDGMLYVGTGDAREPELAQNVESLAGKILRMTPDGKAPDDNPRKGSLVYALGFRNVQGLAWHPETGQLWATSHGPTGEFGLQARDAVYVVEKGGNHGWPRVLGVTDREGVVDPVLYFPQNAVPPALCVFYSGDLMPDLKNNFFFASLRAEHLQRVVVDGNNRPERVERWFSGGDMGRLRAVAQGPDGALYVSTSNRDGRGRVRPGDDRILRIGPN